MSRNSIICLSLLVPLAACTTADNDTSIPVAEAATTSPAGDVMALPESISALDIKNARTPSANLLTAGQITEEQFTALTDLGYGTFVSLRPADENGTGWEEAFAATAGVAFHRLPVQGADGINRDNAVLLAAVLDAAGDDQVVLYCGSSNRVGALLAIKAHELDGQDVESALEIGRAAGLTRMEPMIRTKLGIDSTEE